MSCNYQAETSQLRRTLFYAVQEKVIVEENNKSKPSPAWKSWFGLYWFLCPRRDLNPHPVAKNGF
jgi:hypothetical protein